MILQLVYSFIERTFMATPSYAHVATELGYLFILQEQVKEASLWYSEAMKLDDSSVAALTGLCGLGRGRGGRVLGARQGGLHESRREVLGSILSRGCVSVGLHCMMGCLSVNPQV